MKRCARMLCGLAALLLISHPAASEVFPAPKKEDAKKAKAKKAKNKARKAPRQQAANEPTEVSFEAMKRELSLSAEQQEKLQALWEERAKALSEWDATPQGQKLAQLREDFAVAAGGERAGLAGGIRFLEAQRKQIEQRFDAKILALLKAEQRAKWLGYQLYGQVTERLQGKSVHLTTEQGQKVRAMCDVAGKRMPGIPTSQSMARMRSLLLREIFASVLTDKQKKAIDPDYKPKGQKKNKNRRAGNKNNRRGGGKRGGIPGRARINPKPKPKAKPKPVPKPKAMLTP